MDTVVDWAFLLARILIAILFVVSALKFHFGGVGMRYAESYRAPFPKLLVPLSGLVIVAAALALAAGAWADVAALVLVAFLLVTSYYMHPFWKEADPQAKMGQQVHFLKNLGLVGGLLVLFYAYNQLGGDAALSATEPLLVDEPASGD
jgi:putative oxidoreductase